MFLTQEYKEQWSRNTKIIFRLIFSYLSIYIFLLLLGSLFETPFKWVGKNILRIGYEYDANGFGSGDHTYAYVSLFIGSLLSILATTIWSILDHKRKNYNNPLYWFLVILRVVLISAMFLYGFVKIFQIQFPYPSLTRLLEPLGNFSPMGLAWTYMGYSEGFNLFAGLIEVLGGLLLIPRRTQTLGAFIVTGVMTHVAVMNFMFDIPVKLFSMHLVLMAFVIFMTDIKRFTDVFIKNKSVVKYDFYNPITEVAYHKVIFWIKTGGLALAIISFIIFGYTVGDGGKERTKPYLYGIWEASTFIKNGDTIPPLTTDAKRWRYLIIDQKATATVKAMNDKKYYFSLVVDTSKQKIKMYKKNSETDVNNFDYNYPNYSNLELNGVLENDSLKILFSRKDIDEFLLHSRGFHWINETPLNK